MSDFEPVPPFLTLKDLALFVRHTTAPEHLCAALFSVFHAADRSEWLGKFLAQNALLQGARDRPETLWKGSSLATQALVHTVQALGGLEFWKGMHEALDEVVTFDLDLSADGIRLAQYAERLMRGLAQRHTEMSRPAAQVLMVVPESMRRGLLVAAAAGLARRPQALEVRKAGPRAEGTLEAVGELLEEMASCAPDPMVSQILRGGALGHLQTLCERLGSMTAPSGAPPPPEVVRVELEEAIEAGRFEQGGQLHEYCQRYGGNVFEMRMKDLPPFSTVAAVVEALRRALEQVDDLNGRMIHIVEMIDCQAQLPHHTSLCFITTHLLAPHLNDEVALLLRRCVDRLHFDWSDPLALARVQVWIEVAEPLSVLMESIPCASQPPALLSPLVQGDKARQLLEAWLEEAHLHPPSPRRSTPNLHPELAAVLNSQPQRRPKTVAISDLHVEAIPPIGVRPTLHARPQPPKPRRARSGGFLAVPTAVEEDDDSAFEMCSQCMAVNPKRYEQCRMCKKKSVGLPMSALKKSPRSQGHSPALSPRSAAGSAPLPTAVTPSPLAARHTRSAPPKRRSLRQVELEDDSEDDEEEEE